MTKLKHLLDQNKAWSSNMIQKDPAFFSTLAKQQAPKYLWIGCSDSRVPANQIVGLMPGDIFVHRNIANLVIHTDLNCLSVIQFAVDVLGIKDIIVCGHYGCAGVRAALNKEQIGLADNWLRHIQDVRKKYSLDLDKIECDLKTHDKLCELNVIEQVDNVCQTSIVGEAWRRGQELSVHGWIYDLHDGIIRDLNVTRSTF